MNGEQLPTLDKGVLPHESKERKPLVVIITVREDETRAILKRIPDRKHVVHGNRTYSVGTIRNKYGFECLLAFVKTPEQGPNAAHGTARDAIEDLDPDWIVLLGIAGAVPNQEYTLGDVVVASRLHDFTVGAHSEGELPEFINQGGPVSPQLQDLIHFLPMLDTDLSGWQEDEAIGMPRPPVRLTEDLFYGSPKWRTATKSALEFYFGANPIRVAPIVTARAVASSGKVIKDTKIAETWKTAARDLAAVEMELGGVYAAAQRLHKQYPVLAIRGISDIVGFARRADWTTYACNTAASFCLALLQSIPSHFLIPSRSQARSDKAKGIVETDKRESSVAPGAADDYNIASRFFSARAILPAGFRASVNNFLVSYLGLRENPAIFAGRDEDLRRLSDWLDAEDEPPYLCIATEAGRGKSALLAHWCDQLINRHDWHVIFIPISIRFETNTPTVVLGALASLLADYREEPCPVLGVTPAEVLKGLCREYLSRGAIDQRKLVVVLDGLDEASGWEVGPNLFPAVPPTGLRVVISARTKLDTESSAWLRTLGWNRPGMASMLPLNPLTQRGVIDVVKQSGIVMPETMTGESLGKVIYRASEGDPLLVSLYVDHLNQDQSNHPPVAIDELEKMPPGLGTYFSGWLADQRKLWGRDADWKAPSLHLILSALASAVGPLFREDILSLAGSEQVIDSWTIDETLRTVGRLVIGDGKRQPLTFVHSRLGTYFREEFLTAKERAEWNQRFVAWGQNVIEALRENRIEPQEVPKYLIKFFSTHLSTARAKADDYFTLLSKPWLDASIASEGTPELFLEDAWKVWEAARHQGPEALGQQIRAALCFSSIASTTTKLNAGLLVLCVQQEIISHTLALVIARQKSVASEKVECLCALAEMMPVEEREGLLADALAAGRGIETNEKRAAALVQVAAQLPSPQRDSLFQEARELFRQFHGSSAYYLLEQTKSLWPQALFSELVNEAVEIARSDTNDWSRAWVLESLSKWLQSPQRESILEEALTASQGFPPNEVTQVTAGAKLAVLLPENERQDRLSRLFALATSIDYDWSQVIALSDLAVILPQNGLDKIAEVARSLQNATARSRLLAYLASILPYDEAQTMYAEALEAANSHQDNWFKAAALEELITLVPEQFVNQILLAARNMTNRWARAELLGKLAPRLSGNDQKKALTESFVVSQNIADAGPRALTLACLAPSLSNQQLRAEVIAQALSLANFTWDYEAQAYSLRELANHVKKKNRVALISQALEAALSEPDIHKRTEVIISLLPVLTTEQLHRVLVVAQQPAESYYQDRLMSSLAPYLPSELVPSVIEYLFANDFVLPRLAELLTDFLPRLADTEQAAVIEQILNRARTKTSGWYLAAILQTLAPAVSKPLRQELLKEALAADEEIIWRQAEILLELALDNEGNERSSGIEKGVIAIQQIPDTHSDAKLRLIGKVLPHLTDNEGSALYEEALRIARMDAYAGSRAMRLGRLGIQLHGERRRALLKEALQNIATMDPDDSFHQARILNEFAAHLPDELLASALQVALKVRSHTETPRILTALAPRWTAMCRHDHLASEFEVLSQTLNSFRGCTREDLLEIIRALLPVITRLGGDRAVEDTVRAIRDTADWWP